MRIFGGSTSYVQRLCRAIQDTVPFLVLVIWPLPLLPWIRPCLLLPLVLKLALLLSLLASAPLRPDSACPLQVWFLNELKTISWLSYAPRTFLQVLLLDLVLLHPGFLDFSHLNTLHIPI
jgi:hypothetical protein